jgi:rare lipoprotein A
MLRQIKHIFVAGSLLAIFIMALPACAPYHGGVAQPVHYKATGLASWYGPGFYGRKTASGERFSAKAMTAAHKTLPFGTTVKVTNVDNGKSVVVRINDRGPFVKGRLIDLSKSAASELGLMGEGTASVEVVALNAPGESEVKAPQKTNIKEKQRFISRVESRRYVNSIRAADRTGDEKATGKLDF